MLLGMMTRISVGNAFSTPPDNTDGIPLNDAQGVTVGTEVGTPVRHNETS